MSPSVFTSLICSTYLVTELKLSTELKCGNTLSRLRGCPRGSKRIGEASANAVATPGYAFSAPGPYCMAKTPGGVPFVILEYPSAIPTPTRSWRHITGLIPISAAASMIEVVGKQLR